MIFQVRTVAFRGHGEITCRLCNHKTVFPDNAQVICYTYLGRQDIISATDLTTLHLCGRRFIWWCDTCEEQRPPPTASRRYRNYRGWQGAKACAICGDEIRQRLDDPQAVDIPV